MSLKINIGFEKPVFKIEIVNLYDRPVRLWSFGYLPGYYSFCFSITTNDDNKKYLIKRKLTRWTINVLDFFEINPKQSKSVDVNINDGTWDLSETIEARPDNKIAVSCILSNEVNEETLRYDILTGKYESEKIYFDSINEIIKQ
jgi:hypothetical protein